jgi:putative peptidoglycan lipid II flippase
VARDVACAAFFGAGLVWDAFSFAFRIPNLFRRLFGEGALSAAFVPIFSEYLETHEPEEAWRFAGRIGGALILVLSGILLVAEAGLLLLLGLRELSPRWHLALVLTAVMFPYMLFICLTAVAGAALNSLKHFAAPALAPVVLNVCWIATVIGVAPAVAGTARGQIFVVAAGIVVAGVLQLALQVATLTGKGFRWRLALEPFHPQVRRVVGRMAPVALGLAALQLNVLLDSVIAVGLAAPEGAETFTLAGFTVPYPMEIGANSVLYYGNRLMQFPLGVFGIALATAVFPTLSRHAARRDWSAFAGSVTRGLGAGLFVALPAGVGLILLRRPVIELLFQRGAFTAEMTARTARVLTAYAVAIWAYCALHLLTRAFYSLGRHGTAARVAASMVGVNLLLNLALVWPLREAGLAAATALSATIQAGVLLVLLHRIVPLTGLARLGGSLLRMLAATGCMAGAVLLVLWALPAGDGLAWRFVRALVPAAGGACAYLGVAAVLGSPELSMLLAAMRGRQERG